MTIFTVLFIGGDLLFIGLAGYFVCKQLHPSYQKKVKEARVVSLESGDPGYVQAVRESNHLAGLAFRKSLANLKRINRFRKVSFVGSAILAAAFISLFV